MNQAQRIIKKFGGHEALALALSHVGETRHARSSYRWTNDKGTIPSSVLSWVIQAARVEGILLTAEDLDPRTLPSKECTGNV